MESSLNKSKDKNRKGQSSYGIKIIESMKAFALCDLLIMI
jgi:hypothetical protein